MKVTLKEQPNIMKYPFLGICPKGGIVLFTKFNTGVCLHAGEEYGIVVGQYSEHWAMDIFEPYNGSVTLEND